VQLSVALPSIVETAWWQPSRQLDPGHRWLLDPVVTESAVLGRRAD
jgi:hypothetical protein